MRVGFRNGKIWLSSVFLVGLVAVNMAGPVMGPPSSAQPRAGDADRYFIRVTGCDDGGRAYVNGTLMVNVGFGEDSNWLEITHDIEKKKNEVKFQVINRTGAITYQFQVRKNDEIVYDQSCGRAGVVGCEENRAFRVGPAREFVFRIEMERGSRR